MIFDCKERLSHIIDEAWLILFNRIVSGKQTINKEASLQLQFARIINDLGTTYCIFPDEFFSIELETNFRGKNIDITCQMGQITAAIELKCFIKASNRAKDTDMYDVLKDIERIESYDEFSVTKFYCLTDNKYYPTVMPKGMASSVTIMQGTKYLPHIPIVPLWAGIWNVKRDTRIIFKKEIECHWVNSGKWYYLAL